MKQVITCGSTATIAYFPSVGESADDQTIFPSGCSARCECASFQARDLAHHGRQCLVEIRPHAVGCRSVTVLALEECRRPSGPLDGSRVQVLLPSPSSQPPLVGRDHEPGMLHAGLMTALAGEGRLVLVSGEAGIGKTALANRLSREAADKGAHVLTGHCYVRIELARPGGRPHTWKMRCILDDIFYVLRTGCAWRGRLPASMFVDTL
jgi:hypothetical protein